MPVTSVTKDPQALTMTIVADFPVPLQRLWDAYADPRQLERFWGPPEWPARFTRHDMAVGGRSLYLMTGPDGQTSAGYWEFLDVSAPNFFEVRDGFIGPDGLPNQDLPTMRLTFAFTETEAGSRLTSVTHFNSLADLELVVEMGAEEGARAAMGQMDEVLADMATFAADRPTLAQTLNDTQVRVSRVVRGSVEQVWRAHHEADLVQRWMLGPDGWEMLVCEAASEVGERYRYEWQQVGGGERFGVVGQLVEAMPPHYAVTTESMIGMPGEPTRNELTLTAVQGGTLASLVITYPTAEIRDMALATGMVDGMETGYQRLESVIAGS